MSFTESATAAVPQKKSAFGAVREKKRASAAVLRKKPLAPAESGEELDDVASKAEVKFDELSLVTLNVDGLGEYATAPAARMEAILDEVLVVKPDVLLLQEITFPMFTQLRRRLPEWKVCRKREVSEDYFNVTLMRHGADRTSSLPLPASSNGRHLVITRQRGWTIWNTHAESGSQEAARDARQRQLLHMSRLHEKETDDQFCILAGDLNLHVREEVQLEQQGWRDAWSSRPGVDNWTWCKGLHKRQYDRVFLHDPANGERLECTEIQRLTGVWPALSDHAALHVVVRRTSKQHMPRRLEPFLGHRPSSSATGLAVTSSLGTGQAAHVSETFTTNVERVPVVAIANAIVLCAKAVRNAGLLGVNEVGNTGDQPKWCTVPKECRFKVEKPGGRNNQHFATLEEKTA